MIKKLMTIKPSKTGQSSPTLTRGYCAVTQRAALSYALNDGRAVTEFEPEGKAADELQVKAGYLALGGDPISFVPEFATSVSNTNPPHRPTFASGSRQESRSASMSGNSAGAGV